MMQNFDFFSFFKSREVETNTLERESFKLSGYGESKQGDETHGSINDDYFLWRPDLGLAAVCDGLKNPSSLNSASAAVIRELPLLISQLDTSNEPQKLLEQLEKGIKALHEKIATRKLPVNGLTTLSAILINKNNEAIIAHIGNSRINLIRKKRINILTTDHNRAILSLKPSEQTKILKIFASANKREQIPKNFQEKYREFTNPSLSFVLGAEPFRLQIKHQPVFPGDRLILCTDGIGDHITLPRLLTLCSEKNPESAVRAILNDPGDVEYNQFYPNDDKTAIVIDIS